MMKHQWFGIVCGSFCVAAASAQTLIDNFEYSSDDELLAAWVPSGNAIVTVSDSVAPQSTGKKSMRVEFNFPSSEWATETVRGQDLATVVSIAPTQFLTFRIRGDTAFATADFRNLYLYAYDENGNFGRWGAAVPITPEWQLLNFAASGIEKPWDATELPDLSRIVKFAFFQYGSQAAIDPYTATIYIDDLMVRDAPLTEFPAAAAPRALIDDFESYKDDAALHSFYSYENSPAATVTTASIASPALEGTKALKLGIQFAPGQWPWGSVRSATVAPFSLPTNAVVTVSLKGDPALAAVADAGTTFWLSFYDKAGGRITFSTDAAPVISSEWTTLTARFADFSNTTTVDVGNLVQWRILVEGWQGTAEQAEMSGVFYVDDIRIQVPSGETEQPSLHLTRDSGGLKLSMDHLVPGKAYEVRTSPAFSPWNSATVINATATTATWTVTPNQPKAFFRLVEKTAQ